MSCSLNGVHYFPTCAHWSGVTREQHGDTSAVNAGRLLLMFSWEKSTACVQADAPDTESLPVGALITGPTAAAVFAPVNLLGRVIASAVNHMHLLLAGKLWTIWKYCFQIYTGSLDCVSFTAHPLSMRQIKLLNFWILRGTNYFFQLSQ